MATLHAVIIGINKYARKPLSGCVNDAIAVCDFFRDLCQNQKPAFNFRERVLLAPTTDEEKTHAKDRGINQPEDPTRQNIIAAFDHFDGVEDGDICLFYYSGHGSTAPAPEVFADYEAATGVVQTIVCSDSRINGNPDLLDKELGYLLAKAMHGKASCNGKKGVHMLVIMDCCFAGTNTRSNDDDRGLPVGRFMSEAGNVPTQILGFTKTGNEFYERFAAGQNRVPAGKGAIKHGRYIKLAAAQDHESAQENYLARRRDRPVKHGYFTFLILETLRQNRTNLTYGDLISRVEMAVKSKVDNQNPLLDRNGMPDDELLFLRNELKPLEESFIVQYDQPADRWLLRAGEIQGLSMIKNGQPTTVILTDGTGRIVKVEQVSPAESLLEATVFTEADKTDLTLKATLLQVSKQMSIGFHARLLAEKPAMQASVEAAFLENAPRHVRLAAAGELPELEINFITDPEWGDCLVLCRVGSDVPLFLRCVDVATFLGDVNKIARARQVLDLRGTGGIPSTDIQVKISVLEGVKFGRDTLNQIPDNRFRPVPPMSPQQPWPTQVQVVAKEVDGQQVQPAIKVRISCPHGAYWVGALYCDASHGINPDYLTPVQIGGAGLPAFADLQFNDRGQNYQAIPLKIAEEWAKHGVQEIEDCLLIFVSTQNFDLSNYRQTGVNLDITRDAGFSERGDYPVQKWTVIKIPIRISFPKKEARLESGKTTDFGLFKIETPVGFSATAKILSRSNVSQNSRGDGSESLLPPVRLWGGVESSADVFGRTMAASSDSHLSMMELNGVENADVLNEASPLRLTLRETLQPEETIVPYGLDVESGLYYPIGYTDEQGEVCIVELPDKTDYSLVNSRSLGGSFKLFFQKVIWSKFGGRRAIQTLALHENKGLKITTYQQTDRDDTTRNHIRAALAQTEADERPVLLLVHGIIGDTDGMSRAIFEKKERYESFGAVLTFDYENLDSSIPETAKALHKMLTDCGLNGRRLTILAHSMGGLVARYWIEQGGGEPFVRRLLMVGTPNGGSEIGDLGKKLGNLLTLGLNGWKVAQPHMAVLSFLLGSLSKRMLRSLKDMAIDSPVIADLKDNIPPDEVLYYLLPGDTSQIEAIYPEDANLFKKLRLLLRKRGKYLLLDHVFEQEPNDMAVRIDSMKTVRGNFAEEPKTVACDHISYFEIKAAIAIWEKWLV